jgi:hypothetical protein
MQVAYMSMIFLPKSGALVVQLRVLRSGNGSQRALLLCLPVANVNKLLFLAIDDRDKYNAVRPYHPSLIFVVNPSYLATLWRKGLSGTNTVAYRS